MTVAPRITFVTIGVDDMARSDAFYRELGWEVVIEDGDDFRLFKTAGAWLGVYARSSLQRDMGRELPTGSASMNVAINVESRAEVDAAVDAVRAAGGEVIVEGHAMEWGGYSAYVADPDGHVWEIAHAPAWPFTVDGRLDVTGSEDVVVIFRSRRRTESEPDYAALRPHIAALAEQMPGYVEAKTFTAEDGEHVTIARFDTAEQERAWRNHPEHREAQRRGREEFYASYDIAVCSLVDEWSFTAQ
jgi:catechol 2,3-dioxygenase-like lactoylglutathione lyase family enzyme/heme-degrading monooxygenase HmoA